MNTGRPGYTAAKPAPFLKAASPPFRVLIQVAGGLHLAQVTQADGQVTGKVRVSGWSAPRTWQRQSSVLVQVAGGLHLAQVTQDGGKVTRGHQSAGVVGAQDPAAAPKYSQACRRCLFARPAALTGRPSGPAMDCPKPAAPRELQGPVRVGETARTVARQRFWRGTSRGTSRGTRGREIPVESVRPALSVVLSLQVTAVSRGRVPLVMRSWPGPASQPGMEARRAVAAASSVCCLSVASWHQSRCSRTMPVALSCVEVGTYQRAGRLTGGIVAGVRCCSRVAGPWRGGDGDPLRG